jgi:hypothetical protein
LTAAFEQIAAVHRERLEFIRAVVLETLAPGILPLAEIVCGYATAPDLKHSLAEASRRGLVTEVKGDLFAGAAIARRWATV